MSDIGKFLIALGLVIALVGAVLTLAPRVPWLGRLPGDIRIERGHSGFYFPIVTCIILSILLSIVISLFRR